MDMATLLSAVIQPLLGVICYLQVIVKGFWRNVVIFAPISGLVMFLTLDGRVDPLLGLAAAIGMAVAFTGMLLAARWLDARFGSGGRSAR